MEHEQNRCFHVFLLVVVVEAMRRREDGAWNTSRLAIQA